MRIVVKRLSSHSCEGVCGDRKGDAYDTLVVVRCTYHGKNYSRTLRDQEKLAEELDP